MGHESDGDTNCNRHFWHGHQRISTGTGRFKNKRTSGDHRNHCMVEIGQKSVRSPEDFRRLEETFWHKIRWKTISLHWWKKLFKENTNKWYMHSPISVWKNERHKLLLDFKIQTNHLILARRPDLEIKKRELAELWTLLSRLTIEWNWKKAKRKISTLTLLENRKNYGTWKWRWHQL